MSRPEHIAPPDIFYNEDEAKKYAVNSRIVEIQTRMTERALSMLNLPENRPCYLLDIGCGSGLSGEVLSEHGHMWVGVDISPSMLGVAIHREVEGDVMCADIGHGLNFRPGLFDGAVSVSVLQWLCNADHKDHVPQKRLRRFFQSLYSCLRRGARAVFQVYPETPKQMQLITEAAMKCNFSGGLVIDYPNSTKAKKVYLCLSAGDGRGPSYALPPGLDGDPALADADSDGDADEVAMAGPGESKLALAEAEPRNTILFSRDNVKSAKERRQARRSRKGTSKRGPVKSKDWILAKKERQKSLGKKVANDSKFTGRKRSPKF